MVPRVFGDDELHWIVEPGDTLTKIANYYGRTVAEIAAYNNIDPDRIQPGQRVWIPGPLYWDVEPGDTLGAIAAYYGISVEVLAARNGLADPNRIGVGQRLQII
jgi:LysM repeat protein